MDEDDLLSLDERLPARMCLLELFLGDYLDFVSCYCILEWTTANGLRSCTKDMRTEAAGEFQPFRLSKGVQKNNFYNPKFISARCFIMYKIQFLSL